jgi:adenylate cyclase
MSTTTPPAPATDLFMRMDMGVDAVAIDALRPSGAEVTLRTVSKEAGTDESRAARFATAAGLSPEVAGRQWFTSDVNFFRVIESTASVLGDHAVLALLRRTGAAMAQLAHASSAAFRVKVMSQTHDDHTIVASELVDGFALVLEQLLRHHYVGAIRSRVPQAGNHGELREMCVGFVDLSSSTELGSRVTLNELADLMSEFEAESFHAATVRGARVVKTIGDEVMLCADDPEPVCRAALDLVEYFGRHERFRSARAGLAFGEVIDQDGDCYGPVVNCAARLVDAADDGTVMAGLSVAARLRSRLRFVPVPAVPLRGLGTVEWGQVLYVDDVETVAAEMVTMGSISARLE